MLAALVLLAATCTPIRSCSATVTTSCASPTPVVLWDQIPDATLAGYSVYYNAVGGTPQLLVDIPCSFYDSNADDLPDARFCRAPDLGTPMQRYCPGCAAFNAYEFRIKAYTLAGIRSLDYSSPLTVCFPPIWAGRGTPWN